MQQEKLAELSGFGQQYLTDLERGRRNPSVITLFHIAAALEVVPADLIAFDDGEMIGEGPLPPRARKGRIPRNKK